MQVEKLEYTQQAGADESLSGITALIRNHLCPHVLDIDKGEYPREFLHKLGAIGGFGAMVAPQFGGTGKGLKTAVRIIEDVSRECVSTGFLVWAQNACAWYLQNSSNKVIRSGVLPQVASGKVLGGTGQSNAMKSCVAIEENRLKAVRVKGGYCVNGTLPWVSNIGVDHYFHVGVNVANELGLMIALVRGGYPGLTLNQYAHFIAMEGTNTFACQFKDVFIADGAVVSHPHEFEYFRAHTKSAFILMQMGMGLGLVDACVNMMKLSNKTHSHVNRFLDDQAEDIEAELLAARAACYRLAEKIDASPGTGYERDTLTLRLLGSELSLKAANSAMLHLGAKGYLVSNAAQRRVREAYFVAIVTPAIKHLRKELHDIDADCSACIA